VSFEAFVVAARKLSKDLSKLADTAEAHPLGPTQRPDPGVVVVAIEKIHAFLEAAKESKK
jgi:hypothetical protein